MDLNLGKVIETIRDNEIFIDANISQCKNLLIVNVGQKNPEIHIWDLQQKKIIQKYDGFASNHFIISCSFSQNSRLVGCGDENGIVHIWHRNKPDALKSAQRHG